MMVRVVIAGKTPGPTRTPTPFELQQKRHNSTGEPCRAEHACSVCATSTEDNLLRAK